MKKVKVYITLKESVLDPQGQAVAGALHNLGYKEVQDVRIGKYIELEVEASDGPIETQIEAMCEKLLANTVIENYRYEIEEGVTQ
ncbi:phosphoribosylformylglycinamidine synthase [Pullulanibacillus pueri]|uniref:Phosphoribosylformylglycinamidine synthase subunit PurS n=1 Tax=Pullulanibacillus pueri TaxID=1437324 RepID=A0A8J2ZXF5_9BACL|nr:phosphoribosylformylglycinamidine synthase subunit PurS [Pullulanibacillus pueri]MBM7682760.1 phosphoribosylformylglycinamidine synthase [Pullulanibacillus pueri]GGH83082.1 phosphoribosylformylglycinamidine synthase subunit PurS [Pullulanibacillus pueri]